MPDDESNGNGVRVTNRELYDAVAAVRELVTALRLEIGIMTKTLGSVSEELSAYQKRLSKLEVRYYGILAGLIAGVGTIIANATGVI